MPLRLGFTLFCLGCLHLPLLAQLPAGSINGTTSDASGAVLQGVHITATNDRQGDVREGISNAEGSFVLSDVVPGTYTVEITEPGFSAMSYVHVQVDAGKAVTFKTTLQVASQASVVDVNSSSGTEVNLAQSMLQGQITANTIQSIPLNGRNFLELAFLLPGNRPAPNFDPTKTNTVEISSAGGFGRGGNVLVDGADNNY